MRLRDLGWRRLLAYGGFAACHLFLMSVVVFAQTSILNVSYDVSRELYKDINPAFIAAWRTKTGETVAINQSHGGSSKQALSVTAGLDGGGRGATTTFTQRDVGDVLVTFENVALAIGAELGADKFDVVHPSLSIEAAPPVAIVEKVVDKRGSRKIATAYLEFLFSPQGPEIIARHSFRPRDEAVLHKFAGQFQPIKTFRVEDVLGGWAKVQTDHFADGAIYDQLVVKR